VRPYILCSYSVKGTGDLFSLGWYSLSRSQAPKGLLSIALKSPIAAFKTLLTNVTRAVTIVTDMNTSTGNKNLSSILFGKTRRAVLSLLYGHADESFYLRQIVRATGAGLGPVQRELKQLTAVGIIRRSVQGRQVYYQANPDSPIFKELKSLITKTAGIGDTLRDALALLSDRITIALVYGSVARGEENQRSDIDLLIVGDVAFSEVVKALRSAQEALGREINPTVYPVDEFRSRIAEEHYFIQDVLSGPKIFVIGDEHELKRLAGERLAGQA
jgi:predicted nucleotidyltransferase